MICPRLVSRTSLCVTQLSEVIGINVVSQMSTLFGDLLDWSALNLMNITVIMTVGVNVNPLPQLVYCDETIDRVLCYKLLGVLIDTYLE